MHDPTEHNIEGLIDNEILVTTEDSQLEVRCIQDDEIVETNKEYNYYTKHYMEKVKNIFLHILIKNSSWEVSNLNWL
jgi:hypothetical protein